MRKVSIVITCVFFLTKLYSQESLRNNRNSCSFLKPTIDSSSYGKWTYVDGAKISNDGKYMFFYIRSVSKLKDTTVLKKCIGNWEMRIPGSVNVQFTNDSKMAVFRFKDTLNLIELEKKVICKIPNVKLVKVPNTGNGEWIAFMNSDRELGVRNIRTWQTRYYKDVKNYSFNEDGKFLILEKEEKESGELTQSISLLETFSGNATTVWNGKGLVQLSFDQFATKFALLISGPRGDKSIWYYERAGGRPIMIVNDSLMRNTHNMVLDAISEMNYNEDYVHFSAKKLQRKLDSIETPSVTIWNYQDSKLPTERVIDDQFAPTYAFGFDIKYKRVFQINEDNELILSKSNDGLTYLIQHISGDSGPGDRNWSSSAILSYCVKSVDKDTTLNRKFDGYDIVEASPSGKYIVYFDKHGMDYFSYDITSGIYCNLTKGIKVSWISYYREDVAQSPRGIAGWLDNDKAVLIYDRFDIWMIDPLGRKQPINITNGYGKRNSTVFYLALNYAPNLTLSAHQPLLLNALNLESKKNGFFEKRVDKDGDPLLLTMGDYIYQLISNPYTDNGGGYPIKARDAKRFIVSRMKATESPNYFFTSDFKVFIPLSQVYPEKEYNWYTTELHSWRKEDGAVSQGILYKPENFDSNRTYPVIFYYYEKKSFGLNAYIFPESISGMCNLNIPTFVSNNFLIFSPDIDYKKGSPMQGTYDAVVSAASYVSKLPFIDSKRMGIGGCSFGGLQTNYLVTHSNLFAAAYSSSSISDLISAYGDVPARYASLASYFEVGQGRMGGTLWQKQEAYIRNSPIFNADRVTAPLLMMHTTNDGISSFSQALEFFTALRRLGKRVWLLEYQDGNHGIGGRSADDFGIRLLQFFNHYLKDYPAPVWMTKVRSSNVEKWDDEYRLDYNTQTPGQGLINSPAK